MYESNNHHLLYFYIMIFDGMEGSFDTSLWRVATLIKKLSLARLPKARQTNR